MSKQSVYNQLTTSPTDLFSVMRDEIGVKSNCTPFANKAITALRKLGTLTEMEKLEAGNTFLDNMQTLAQGGITVEDYDKIDFVKRGKVITISARVEAFLRAAKRKGYMITETIVAVPTEDAKTTYYKENFENGRLIYKLEDVREQPDREITAERIASKYFIKFLCRLNIIDMKTKESIPMIACEMSNNEILNAAASSDDGIFTSRWEKQKNSYGDLKNKKIVTNEINKGSIWYKWTSEMVAKTIIRRALKRVKEVLPELSDTIYAFESDVITVDPIIESRAIEIPLSVVNVDLNNLTQQQKEDVQETFELFKANPKLAADKADEIKAMFNGSNLQEVINLHYADIANIKLSKKLYPVIRNLFEGAEIEEVAATDGLMCSICKKEIKNKKSIDYYTKNPKVIVKCYSCKQNGVQNG